LVGFPLIAAGSILQIVGVATGTDHPTATKSAARRSVVCEVGVSFLPGATNANIAAARDAVSKNSDVESIRFVSSAEAFALMKKRFPDLAKTLPANPLGASLRITLRPGASTASIFRDLNRVMGLPRGNRLSTHTCT
jgi:cell division protein FtsX